MIFLCSAQQKAWPRLSTQAVCPRRVRTDIHSRDPSVMTPDVTNHPRIDLGYNCWTCNLPADHRLVGYYDNLDIETGQPVKGLEHQRQETKLSPTLDVIGAIHIDRSITVEKYRAASAHRLLTCFELMSNALKEL